MLDEIGGSYYNPRFGHSFRPWMRMEEIPLEEASKESSYYFRISRQPQDLSVHNSQGLVWLAEPTSSGLVLPALVETQYFMSNFQDVVMGMVIEVNPDLHNANYLNPERFIVEASRPKKRLFSLGEDSLEPRILLDLGKQFTRKEMDFARRNRELEKWNFVYMDYAIRRYPLSKIDLATCGYTVDILPEEKVPSEFRNRVF